MRSLISVMVVIMDVVDVNQAHITAWRAVSFAMIPPWWVFFFRCVNASFAMLNFSRSWRRESSMMPQRAPTIWSFAVCQSLSSVAVVVRATLHHITRVPFQGHYGQQWQPQQHRYPPVWVYGDETWQDLNTRTPRQVVNPVGYRHTIVHWCSGYPQYIIN